MSDSDPFADALGNAVAHAIADAAATDTHALSVPNTLAHPDTDHCPDCDAIRDAILHADDDPTADTDY